MLFATLSQVIFYKIIEYFKYVSFYFRRRKILTLHCNYITFFLRKQAIIARSSAMTKESTMTIRIEPELRDSFTAVAELVRRPAAQIMRDLMREFVSKNCPALSPEEITNRKNAAQFARASMALEGFTWDADLTADFERYVNGHVSLETLIENTN